MKRLQIEIDGVRFETETAAATGDALFDVQVAGADEQRRLVRVLRRDGDPLVLVGERVVSLRALRERQREREVHFRGAVRRALVAPPGMAAERDSAAAESVLSSPMPGRIVSVSVTAGDRVEPGQLLLVIEAMKMQNELYSQAEARIDAVLVKAGDTVERGAALLRFG